MKHLFNIKTIGFGLIMASVVTMTIAFSGCDKKDDPPASSAGGSGGGGGNTSEIDYILFDGYRLEMKNPVKGTIKLNAGDTTFQWRGNQPTSIDGDTFLYIDHGTILRKAQTYTKFVDIVFNEGEVSALFKWGTSFGKPDINIKSGTYKLERVNGFWVSTLKNGTGEWDRGSGDIKTYTGIEFRATWPD